MSEQLSARQHQLLGILLEAQEHGRIPSLRQMQQALGIKSAAPVVYELEELAVMGYAPAEQACAVLIRSEPRSLVKWNGDLYEYIPVQHKDEAA